MQKRYDSPRPHVPVEVERRVKVEAGHKCAVAHCNDVVIQLHHIDGDRSNNDAANLVPLCGSHHTRVHRGEITAQELRMHKQRLAAAINTQNRDQFDAAEDRRRVANFASAVHDLFTWRDGDAIQWIDDQWGYWFPLEIRLKIEAFLARERRYAAEWRSSDAAVAHTQDAIMNIAKSVAAEVRQNAYIETGYCLTYRPVPKGTPGFDQMVDEQRDKFIRLARDLMNGLRLLDNYVQWRSSF